jgi:hypothetical protein
MIKINGRIIKNVNTSGSISITSTGVKIDGKLVGDFSQTDDKEINIQIDGNVDNLAIEQGSVNVSGDVGDLSSRSGSVNCGDVSGDVMVRSGNVVASSISGSVETRSGNIISK